MARINTLDRDAYYNYMKLDTGDKVLATYIWIDGTGQVRSLVFVDMSSQTCFSIVGVSKLCGVLSIHKFLGFRI